MALLSSDNFINPLCKNSNKYVERQQGHHWLETLPTQAPVPVDRMLAKPPLLNF